MNVCKGKSKFLFAWNESSRNKMPFAIPEGVAFRVGPQYPYIVIQLHYIHLLQTPDYASVELFFTDKK